MSDPEQIQEDQTAFARSQMTAEQREQQRQEDRAEIKIKLIENAIIVKDGQGGWRSFPTWAAASFHINSRIKALMTKRNGA